MNPDDPFSTDPAGYDDATQSQDLTGSTSSLFLAAASVFSSAVANQNGSVAPGTLPQGYTGGSGGANATVSIGPNYVKWGFIAGVALLALFLVRK